MKKFANRKVDVYFVVKGEKIQLSPVEIKHLRRCVHRYDWSIDKKNDSSPLAIKLKRLGWRGSLNRKPKVTHPEAVRERGCQICGTPQNRNKDNIIIHHIIPASEKRGVNARHNLMGLCVSCHLELHKEIVSELRKSLEGKS